LHYKSNASFSLSFCKSCCSFCNDFCCQYLITTQLKQLLSYVQKITKCFTCVKFVALEATVVCTVKRKYYDSVALRMKQLSVLNNHITTSWQENCYLFVFVCAKIIVPSVNQK
jgi:hypothetical protein